MSTLIATLGSEAQVVTLALDLLAARGRPIQTVVVLHTSTETPVIGQALARLTDALRAYRGLRVRATLLRDADGAPLVDVDTKAGAAAVFSAFHHVVRQAKAKGERVDICLAGGRKTMSVYAMVTAQLLFDEDDRLWHLVSAGLLLAEKRMRLQPGDDVALIELPVIRLRDVAPAAAIEMANADDPFAAVERIESRLRELKVHRALEFVQRGLTPAEQAVSRLALREGLSDKQIAVRQKLSTRTVNGHLTSIYRKAEEAFGLPQVSARTLASLLAPIAVMDW